MEVAFFVILVFFVVAGGILQSPLVDILLDVRDDLNNRNDRGRLKRPGDKYVV
jgi:hypothetical protein